MPPQTPTPTPQTPDFSKAFVGGAPQQPAFTPPQPTDGPADYSKAFVDQPTDQAGGPVRNLPDPSIVSPQAQQQLDAAHMSPLARDANTAATGFLSGVSGVPQTDGEFRPADFLKQGLIQGALGPAIPIAQGIGSLYHNIKNVISPDEVPNQDPQDALESRINSGSQLVGNAVQAALLHKAGPAIGDAFQSEPAPEAPAPAPAAPEFTPFKEWPAPTQRGVQAADAAYDTLAKQQANKLILPQEPPAPEVTPIQNWPGETQRGVQAYDAAYDARARSQANAAVNPPPPPPPGPPELVKYPEWPTRVQHDAARNPAPAPKPEVTPLSEGPTANQHAAVRSAQTATNRANARPFVPMSESPVKPPPPAPEPEPPGPPDFSRISEGPTAQMHAAVRGAQAQVARTNARQIFPLREAPTPDVDGEEPTQAPGVKLNAERNESIGPDNIIRPPDAPSQTPQGNAAPRPRTPRAPQGPQIVSPNSPAPKPTITYQSASPDALLQMVRSGDRQAIAEWQRRSLPLPPNVRFMVER